MTKMKRKLASSFIPAGEPDELLWTDPATGYLCAIRRPPITLCLCGYVAVPPEHGCFEVPQEDLCEYEDMDVHGGITFAGPEMLGYEGTERLWWVGFDTAHTGDLIPAFATMGLASFGGTYRDIEYVKNEVAKLARGLERYRVKGGVSP